MQRIVIIGCTGAGKSVFAQKLSRLLGLKLHHLDSLFWQGRREPDRNEWFRIQEEITNQPSWIIEGNYGATIDVRLKRADTAIFLDFSTVSCVLGLLKRIVLSKIGLEKRPDIIPGLNERIDTKLLQDALTFNRKHRKGILKGIERYSHIQLITLRNRREAEQFLRSNRASG